MDQPAQLEAPEAWLYGSRFEVWPHGLFTTEQMSAEVQVSCVYNYPPWFIRQLTINDLANLWNVPLLLQYKLEELDQIYILVQFFHQCQGKSCSLQVIIS